MPSMMETPAPPALSRMICLSRRRLHSYMKIGFVAALMAALLSACSPLYIMRAAYGEGKILWRREPIADFIERSEVTPDKQEKRGPVLGRRAQARGRRRVR